MLLLRLPKVIFSHVVVPRKFKSGGRKKRSIECKLFGLLSWADLFEIYTVSDILYAFNLKKEFEGAVPSKLYEYLSTGKFIIYGV